MNPLTDNMKILWLFVLIHAVLTQSDFGTSYLKNSELCRQWSCVNSKLGLLDSLPTPAQFGSVLRGLLPSAWHAAAGAALDTCYHDRPRQYTNTCPGQALLHCTVDQLNANCPEQYQSKEYACTPVYSLAGSRAMFTQSRYENIEKNTTNEPRPAWFLRNYFNTKCCEIPALFNATALSGCSFTGFIQFYTHNTIFPSSRVLLPQRRFFPPLLPTPNSDFLQALSRKDNITTNSTNNGDSLQAPYANDPLDCCDISDFILPSWSQECSLHLGWEDQSRLFIKYEEPPTAAAPESTSTSRPVRRDITIVPHSCEKETCVFTKLNIITNGTVDTDAFTRLLDHLTSTLPSWTSAKGRVLTTCLRKPLTEYTDECEINKVLSCTFDVLTENCPHATKNDMCKHSVAERTCQISSSKYRPKHRREICMLPDLVDRKILTECDLASLSYIKPVTTLSKPKPTTITLGASNNKCKDLTPSTTCVLAKMGVLNIFGFIDYFKMKDRIRNYTASKDPTLEGVYLNAFNSGILYNEYCNSPKKFLNLLDSMIKNCPNISKITTQCTNIIQQMKNTSLKQNATQEYAQREYNNQRVRNRFRKIFPPMSTSKLFRPVRRKIEKPPIFHYGILNDKNAPKVYTVDVKPIRKPLVVKPPLVLLPVYMRVPHSNLMIRRPFIENGVMRGFPMNNHITQPLISTTPVSTIQPIPTYSTRPFRPSITPLSIRFKFPKDVRFEMLKPE